MVKSRSIAKAVSRRLPTAAARVRSQVRSYAIRDGKGVTEACFLRVLQFPLPIPIPPNAVHSLIIRPCIYYTVLLKPPTTTWAVGARADHSAMITFTLAVKSMQLRLFLRIGEKV
jgi:hypothetical protein